mmetsp:Transcript_3156/g.9634  ORF Transcript_3156/g.9634 Transcript_3156/m.9634 type:complete len:589 (+) Transcript_3156:1107-2873(+)
MRGVDVVFRFGLVAVEGGLVPGLRVLERAEPRGPVPPFGAALFGVHGDVEGRAFRVGDREDEDGVVVDLELPEREFDRRTVLHPEVPSEAFVGVGRRNRSDDFGPHHDFQALVGETRLPEARRVADLRAVGVPGLGVVFAEVASTAFELLFQVVVPREVQAREEAVPRFAAQHEAPDADRLAVVAQQPPLAGVVVAAQDVRFSLLVASSERGLAQGAVDVEPRRGAAAHGVRVGRVVGDDVVPQAVVAVVEAKVGGQRQELGQVLVGVREGLEDGRRRTAPLARFDAPLRRIAVADGRVGDRRIHQRVIPLNHFPAIAPEPVVPVTTSELLAEVRAPVRCVPVAPLGDVVDVVRLARHESVRDGVVSKQLGGRAAVEVVRLELDQPRAAPPVHDAGATQGRLEVGDDDEGLARRRVRAAAARVLLLGAKARGVDLARPQPVDLAARIVDHRRVRVVRGVGMVEQTAQVDAARVAPPESRRAAGVAVELERLPRARRHVPTPVQADRLFEDGKLETREAADGRVPFDVVERIRQVEAGSGGVGGRGEAWRGMDIIQKLRVRAVSRWHADGVDVRVQVVFDAVVLFDAVF